MLFGFQSIPTEMSVYEGVMILEIGVSSSCE
jgi:hypothetical protein